MHGRRVARPKDIRQSVSGGTLGLRLWLGRDRPMLGASGPCGAGARATRISSDCDILAVRFPYVYEPIGGQPDDWDTTLQQSLVFGLTLGVICEVKTGTYDLEDLFRPQYVEYSLGRLGFVPYSKVSKVAARLRRVAVLTEAGQWQIGKLLIANECNTTKGFIYRDLRSVRGFLQRRIEKYPEEKYRDRMFFDSVLFQGLIDLTVNLDIPSE